MVDIARLRIELTTDPLSRGYSDMSPGEVVVSLNQKDRTQQRDLVPAWEVLSAIRPAHYQAVTDETELRYLTLLFSVDEIPLGNSNIRTALATIFSGATATLNDLQALQTVSVSRAQELNLGRIYLGHVLHVRLS